MALLPPLEKGGAEALLARVNADPSLPLDKSPAWELVPQYLGLHPTKDEAAAWQKAFPDCRVSFPDPWTLATPNHYAPSYPPLLGSPERMIAASKLTPPCLSRRLLASAAEWSAKRGHRAKARALLGQLEAADPDVADSAVWLAIDAYPEAKARAEKALASQASADERLNLSLAQLGLHDFAGAYENAVKARQATDAATNQAPKRAMQALWIMTAAGAMLHRGPPADLVRYEHDPSGSMRDERFDSEDVAVDLWRASVDTPKAQKEERTWFRGLHWYGNGVECSYWLATAMLAKDTDLEGWLDGLDGELERTNIGHWRGGAIARARCRAMILGVMDRPSAKTWTERADRLGALINDENSALLAYFVGL
jgi:hypothetical protein